MMKANLFIVKRWKHYDTLEGYVIDSLSTYQSIKKPIEKLLKIKKEKIKQEQTEKLEKFVVIKIHNNIGVSKSRN